MTRVYRLLARQAPPPAPLPQQAQDDVHGRPALGAAREPPALAPPERRVVPAPPVDPIQRGRRRSRQRRLRQLRRTHQLHRLPIPGGFIWVPSTALLEFPGGMAPLDSMFRAPNADGSTRLVPALTALRDRSALAEAPARGGLHARGARVSQESSDESQGDSSDDSSDDSSNDSSDGSSEDSSADSSTASSAESTSDDSAESSGDDSHAF